jgi:hypothetical protein
MSLNTLPPPVKDKFWIDDTNSFGINSLNAINSPIQPLDTIQGKMITAKLEIDEHTGINLDDDILKKKVLNMLLNELLSAKCIEFTKQQDVATNTTVIRARIFATPDTQVRIIREATK